MIYLNKSSKPLHTNFKKKVRSGEDLIDDFNMKTLIKQL